jgi:exosome complex exonuclease DIS3/RRP44
LQGKIPMIILCEKKIENLQMNGVFQITVEEYIKEWMKESSEIYLSFYDSLLTKFENLSLDDDEYEKHLNLETIELGVSRGIYYRGSLKVQKNNSREAQLKISQKGMDDNDSSSINVIQIHGRKNMNRTIHGDIVAVELLPESEWIDEVPSGKVIGIIQRSLRE